MRFKKIVAAIAAISMLPIFSVMPTAQAETLTNGSYVMSGMPANTYALTLESNGTLPTAEYKDSTLTLTPSSKYKEKKTDDGIDTFTFDVGPVQPSTTYRLTYTASTTGFTTGKMGLYAFYGEEHSQYVGSEGTKSTARYIVNDGTKTTNSVDTKNSTINTTEETTKNLYITTSQNTDNYLYVMFYCRGAYTDEYTVNITDLKVEPIVASITNGNSKTEYTDMATALTNIQNGGTLTILSSGDYDLKTDEACRACKNTL